MMSKDALPSLDASLPRVLADLEGLGIEGLRRQWRNHLGGEAPTHLPRWLFLSVLGHRLQTAAFGDIDKATRRMIQGEGERGARAPFDRRDPQTREGVRLKAGALLVREWQGKLERVMVLDEGFAWNGKTYGSLSQIAKSNCEPLSDAFVNLSKLEGRGGAIDMDRVECGHSEWPANVGEGQRRDGGRRSLFGDTGRAHALDEAFALDVNNAPLEAPLFLSLESRARRTPCSARLRMA